MYSCCLQTHTHNIYDIEHNTCIKFIQALLLGLLLATLSNAQPPSPTGMPPPTGTGMPGGGGMNTGDLTCSGNNLVRCPMSEPYQPVSKTANSDYLLISTTGCPPYPQNWTVQQETCIVSTVIEIPLNPKFASTPVPVVTEQEEFRGITYLAEDPTPILGAIGILDNGVYIYGSSSPCGFGANCPSDGTGAPTQYVDAVDSEGHTIDYCGGHPTPFLEYHVHSGASFSDRRAGRERCGLETDTDGNHSIRLGWMYDGFGLYGSYSQGGMRPTGLDSCSGHTHEIDGVMTYHYHIPDAFPWIIGCFKGCPKVSNNEQELAFSETGNYGCPEGLADDPNPLIEPDPSGGHASTIRVYAAPVLLVVLAAMLLF